VIIDVDLTGAAAAVELMEPALSADAAGAAIQAHVEWAV
jgi:hypothetical protein